jgi:hypothetical protein
MPLPHFTNIQSHNKLWEPVYKNLFEVEIFLPDAIRDKHPNGTLLLLENIKTASLPTYPTLATVSQSYKYSTRLFVGFPDSTSLTGLKFTMNVNQNDTKQIFTYRMVKDWYDLSWNNEDGSSSYKKNAVGEIVLYQHDREGEIIRRVTYHDCIPTDFSVSEDLTWGGGAEIADLTTTYMSSWFEDYYF